MRRRLAILLLIPAAGVAAAYMAHSFINSPSYALYRLRKAFEKGDVAGANSLICPDLLQHDIFMHAVVGAESTNHKFAPPLSKDAISAAHLLNDTIASTFKSKFDEAVKDGTYAKRWEGVFVSASGWGAMRFRSAKEVEHDSRGLPSVVAREAPRAMPDSADVSLTNGDGVTLARPIGKDWCVTGLNSTQPPIPLPGFTWNKSDHKFGEAYFGSNSW